MALDGTASALKRMIQYCRASYFLPRGLRREDLALARRESAATTLRLGELMRPARLARFAAPPGFAVLRRFATLRRFAGLLFTAALTRLAALGRACTAAFFAFGRAAGLAGAAPPRSISRIPGFSSVDMSLVISSPRAIERSSRRMIFPDRVFGRLSVRRISSGLAIGLS